MNRLPFMVTPRKLLYRKERILSTNKSVLAHYNCSGSLREASRHNPIQSIGATTKQGRPKATTTTKMMPCVSRHYGNFSHHETASPQQTASAKSKGLVITSWFSTNRSGAPRGASHHNAIQYIGVTIKQGRPKATTTLDNGVPSNAITLFLLHENHLTIEFVKCHHSYQTVVAPLGEPPHHNAIQYIGVTIKQGRLKATTTAKMMPCISRHHGNFFQNVTASP